MCEHTNVEPTNNPINDHIPQLFPFFWILWTRILLARPERDLLELHTDDEKNYYYFFYGLDWISQIDVTPTPPDV